MRRGDLIARQHGKRDYERVERAKVQRQIEQGLPPAHKVVYHSRHADKRNGEKQTYLGFVGKPP